MPRLGKVNLLGVLLAAIAIYVVGFLWYGLMFAEPYMNGVGVYFNETRDAVSWLGADGIQTRSAAEAEAAWMVGGFLIPLVLAFGLGWLMKQQAIATPAAAAVFGLLAALLIGVPLMAYGLVYTPWHSWTGFAVDASHTVVSFVAACIVLSLFD